MDTGFTAARGLRGLGLMILLGLVFAAVIFGSFYYAGRLVDRNLKVVGAAEKTFQADTAKWKLGLLRTAPDDGVADASRRLKADVAGVLASFEDQGIPADAITVHPVELQQRYGNRGPEGYEIRQGLTVVSQNVGALEKLATNPDFILGRGLLLQSSRLEYYASRLAELKRELLGLAAVDAKKRAASVAAALDRRVGDLRASRAGVFQITEPLSTEVSHFGRHSTDTREKRIAVTVHAEFGIR